MSHSKTQVQDDKPISHEEVRKAITTQIDMGGNTYTEQIDIDKLTQFLADMLAKIDKLEQS